MKTTFTIFGIALVTFLVTHFFVTDVLTCLAVAAIVGTGSVYHYQNMKRFFNIKD